MNGSGGGELKTATAKRANLLPLDSFEFHERTMKGTKKQTWKHIHVICNTNTRSTQMYNKLLLFLCEVFDVALGPRDQLHGLPKGTG